MTHFVWSDDYLIGDNGIDAQHKQLFVLANLLYESVANKKDNLVIEQAFKGLLLYVRKHFADEEEFYAKIGSPFLEDHREEHQALEREVATMWMVGQLADVQEVGAKLEAWVENRLLPHVLQSDLKAAKSANID